MRPVRGGGHHQEHADPAKYGKFLLPHVADGHKQVAKVRPPSFPRMVKKDATTLRRWRVGLGRGNAAWFAAWDCEGQLHAAVRLRGAISRSRGIEFHNSTWN